MSKKITKEIVEKFIQESIKELLKEEEDAAAAPVQKPEYENSSLDAAVDAKITKAEADCKTEEGTLDPNKMASEIARIVNQYASILDIEGTIARRALNYLSKENPSNSKSVEKILQDQFSISTDPGYNPDFQGSTAPPGAGAGPDLA